MTPNELRVLVVSHDRRFASVTAFLLARHGAVVDIGRGRAEAARLIDEKEADLVLLDCGDSLTEAAEIVARLRLRSSDALVIALADGVVRAPQRVELTVWPKWENLGSLLAMAREARDVRDAEPEPAPAPS